MIRSAPLSKLLMLMAVGLAASSSPKGEKRDEGAGGARTAEVAIDFNGGFEAGDGDLSGWQVEGTIADVDAVPKDPPPACFQPDMPSEGNFMACLSTGTFFGGSADGGVRSDLTSEAITLPFKATRLKLSFTVDFQTEEPIPSIAFNDAFQARLITPAGTFVILQIDTFGRTEPRGGLQVAGFAGFVDVPAACPLSPGAKRTRKLTVIWTKNIDPILRRAIGTGPVFIEFSIANQGNPDRTSLACVDDVKLNVSKGR